MNENLDEAQLDVVMMFLAGIAKLWWRNHIEDLASRCITEKIGNCP
jgi:hypothetical protein